MAVDTVIQILIIFCFAVFIIWSLRNIDEIMKGIKRGIKLREKKK
jgi:TRAP-type C4-dicarboxylate transport system permease small subunit